MLARNRCALSSLAAVYLSLPRSLLRGTDFPPPIDTENIICRLESEARQWDSFNKSPGTPFSESHIELGAQQPIKKDTMYLLIKGDTASISRRESVSQAEDP